MTRAFKLQFSWHFYRWPTATCRSRFLFFLITQETIKGPSETAHSMPKNGKPKKKGKRKKRKTTTNNKSSPITGGGTSNTNAFSLFLSITRKQKLSLLLINALLIIIIILMPFPFPTLNLWFLLSPEISPLSPLPAGSSVSATPFSVPEPQIESFWICELLRFERDGEEEVPDRPWVLHAVRGDRAGRQRFGAPRAVRAAQWDRRHQDPRLWAGQLRSCNLSDLSLFFIEFFWRAIWFWARAVVSWIQIAFLNRIVSGALQFYNATTLLDCMLRIYLFIFISFWGMVILFFHLSEFFWIRVI